MKNKKIIQSFFLMTIFFLVGFFLINHSTRIYRPANIHQVGVAGQTLVVDIVNTDEQRQLGLSGRKSMAENEGMLFVFDSSGKYPFWMKDMNFGIDIIWIAEDGKVVYIKKDARPELYPETYSSDKDAKYVLEVVAGFSDKNNLKEGDRIKFYR